MANRFYVNSPLAPGQVLLEGAEAHHLATVSRVRPGDQVSLFNGDGCEYLARVTEARRRRVELEILAVERPAREPGIRIEVAAPLPKGDRAQFLLEKLTELGVAAYVPLSTRRSVVQPGEGKQGKLERYVIEASKQCGRNTLMRVAPPASWESYCWRPDLPALRFVAHPGGVEAVWPAGRDLALAVGPEGGFADEEIEAARTAGWKVVHLGPRVLRIETAALVMAAWACR